MSEISCMSCDFHFSGDHGSWSRRRYFRGRFVSNSCTRTPRMCDIQQEMIEYIEAKML